MKRSKDHTRFQIFARDVALVYGHADLCRRFGFDSQGPHLCPVGRAVEGTCLQSKSRNTNVGSNPTLDFMVEKLDTDTPCLCGRDAAIHSLVIQYGVRTEKHQCSKCASQEQEAEQRWANFKPGDMK